MNVKNLLIYKHYKNKESYNKSKIPMHSLPLGWKFKWLKKLTGKTAISVVYDIQPADMKIWWKKKKEESLMDYISPKHYYNPSEKSKLNRMEIKFSGSPILLEHLS